MLKRLFEKNELLFAIGWIGVYCIAMSLGDVLSEGVGVACSVTLPVAAVLSGVLFLFLKRNGLMKRYGLCRPKNSPAKMLYYVPVLVMLTANLRYGIHLAMPAGEAVLYALTMLCVGFLEELIFRGLLFRAMGKDGIPSAIVISSLTFGMGHIINLFNGAGAELIPNLLQVIYAAAAGFMFVMMYYRSGSLLACIAGHGVFNALSVFTDEKTLTVSDRIGSCVFLVLVCGGYGAYLAFSGKREENWA